MTCVLARGGPVPRRPRQLARETGRFDSTARRDKSREWDVSTPKVIVSGLVDCKVRSHEERRCSYLGPTQSRTSPSILFSIRRQPPLLGVTVDVFSDCSNGLSVVLALTMCLLADFTQKECRLLTGTTPVMLTTTSLCLSRLPYRDPSLIAPPHP